MLKLAGNQSITPVLLYMGKMLRETISRLAAENKKLTDQLNKLAPFQQQVNELRESLDICEKEKKNFLDRLMATKDNVSSLQKELEIKEKSCVELRKNIERIQSVYGKEKDTEHEHTKFIDSISALLDCQSTNIKQKIQELIENLSELNVKLSEEKRVKADLQHQLENKTIHLKELEDHMKVHETKHKDLLEQLNNMEILEKKVYRQDEKYKSFIRKCASVLRLEATTAAILAGDFAEDAILLKAEQLCKSETQVLAEKQSMVYSLQRKLKSSQKQVESKELQVNLLQRKITALEERVTLAVEKETQWQSTLDKGKKMTDQFDKLQNKLSQQKEMISHLKEDSEMLAQLKTYCAEQELMINQLEKEVENLQETRVHLSQQLADARQKIHTAVSVDTEKINEYQEALKANAAELNSVKEREVKLVNLRGNISELMDVHDECDDEELLKELKQLKLSCQKYKDLSNDLQACLRTMESSFRTSYEDTLSLLKNEI
jgi:chromosome segregation ATPase